MVGKLVQSSFEDLCSERYPHKWILVRYLRVILRWVGIVTGIIGMLIYSAVTRFLLVIVAVSLALVLSVIALVYSLGRNS